MGGIGFGSSVCLLTLGSKADFAVYSLVLGFIQFSQNIHNAVVITPLMANTPRLNTVSREPFIRRMLRLGSMAALVFGFLVGGLVYAGVSEIPAGGTTLALASFCALVGIWAREHRRSLHFLRLDSWNVLRGDLLYAGLIVATLALAYLSSSRLTTSTVFIALGIGGILTGKLDWGRFRDQAETRKHSASVPVILREQVSWTVPSVVVSWLYSNSYVYIVAGLIGLNALAELNAARLLVAPVSLLQVAWNRLYLPSAGAQFASGNRTAAFRGAWVGVLAVAGGTVLYGVLLIGSMSLPTFSHIQKLTGISAYSVLLWILYFLVAGTRGVATNLHIAQTAFRRLFLVGLAGTAVGLACMVALGREFGASGVVVAMIAGEAALAIFLWARAVIPRGLRERA
jgi:O-antigen/teichoic acid export membrane protein